MYYLKYPISGYVERSVCFLSTITTTSTMREMRPALQFY